MRLNAGSRLDGLRVVGLLGQGATSEVYLVEDQLTKQRHALKLLTARGEGHQARMRREAATVTGLRHDNVVGVFGMLDPDDGVAVLMEFVAGPTLHAWSQKHRATPEEATRIFVGLLRGVGALHERALIHRDLKPGNVLLSVDERGVIPRVADFGLVKDVSRIERQTMTGMAMGTPAYMAPEQLKDASRVDHRADLFSLGCMYYELVVGEPPFRRDDWWETYKAVEAGEQADMARLATNVDPEICGLIQGLLQPDPGDRPQSAAEALQQLEPLTSTLDGDPGTLLTRREGWRVARTLAEELDEAIHSAGIDGMPDLTGLAQSLTPEDVRSVSSETERSVDDWGGPAAKGWVWAVVAICITIPAVLILATWMRGGPLLQSIGEPFEASAPIAPEAPKAKVLEPAPTPSEPALVPSEPDSATLPGTPESPAARPTTQATPTPAAVVRPKREPSPEVVVEAPIVVEQVSEGAPQAAETEPAPPPGGLVQLSGDASEVRLAGPSGESVSIDGPVPPGTYTIRVRWSAADDPVSAGTVEVPPGGSVSLVCRSAFLRCTQ